LLAATKGGTKVMPEIVIGAAAAGSAADLVAQGDSKE
jgi:hypothetical protein